MSTVNYLLQKDSWLNENQHFNSIEIRMRKKNSCLLAKKRAKDAIVSIRVKPIFFPDKPLFFEPLLVMAGCSSCHLYLRCRFHILNSCG